MEPAIVIIDKGLKIRLFSPSAQKILNLSSSTVGLPITTIKLNVIVEDLGEIISEVTSKLSGVTKEVNDAQGHYYEMRIQPYITQDDRIDGAVLAFSDITERKTRNDREIESLTKFPSENPNPVFRIDRKGTILFGNQAGASFLVGWNSKVGEQAPVHIKKVIAQALTTDKRIELEETYGAKTFSLLFAPITVGGYVNIYGTDVTERKKAEEALNKLNEELEERVLKRTEEVSAERQRLYNVLETLPAYVVLLDKNYCVPFANKVFRERFGESHGRRCYDFLFKRESPCENCETYKVMKTKGPHHWEWTGPDGRDYDIYDFPFIEANCSTLILEMGIDITERKRVEKQIRDASLYSRTLIEASLDPLVTISAEGKITDVNHATEIATGCSREELIGNDFSGYFTEPEKAKIGYKQVFNEGFVRDYPLAIRNKSGKITDVLYNATIYTNEAGEMQGVFAAARDITQQKRAEEQYHMLFDSIDEGFCVMEMVFNADGSPSDYRFLEVNLSFERQTGLHDAKGKLMRSFAPNHEAYWFEIYGKVAVTGKPIRFTNEAKALNRFYDVYAFPVGEGKIRKVGILFNDISQQKKLEKQLQDSERLAAIGATAGMVGHDIRNPLQAITSDVYLLQSEIVSMPESDDKKNAEESLDGIEENVDYISKIVADLQDFARPLKPNAEETDLRLIIDELLRKYSLPKNIKVIVKVKSDVRKIMVDSAYLNRILFNSVTNAVQAMPEGGKLTIHAFKESSDIAITVKDTGVGIPEDVKGKLFTPMFTTKAKGQGFGLAVIKRMTDALGGTVSFESQEGKGTTFIIRLPQRNKR
jgi:PAS domain S-box-containing protein